MNAPVTRARALADGLVAILAERPGETVHVAGHGLLCTGGDEGPYSDALAATLRGLGWVYDEDTGQWLVTL